MPAALRRRIKGKAMISANARAAVLIRTIGLAGIFGVSPSAAQDAPPDVAHVAAVSGRVVAWFAERRAYWTLPTPSATGQDLI
jgi:hypothetical protein